MRGKFALALLGAVLAAGVARGDDAPTVPQCAQAYEVLDQLKHKAQGLDYQASQEHKSGRDWWGLGNYAENFRQIDFHARADDLEKRFKDKFDPWTSVVGYSMDSIKIVEDMILEGPGLRLDALLAPQKIFAHQRPWFERAHACDIAYGQTPVLGTVPDTQTLVNDAKAQMDREREQNEAHLANLSDMQCTVRFAAAAQLSPGGSPAQVGMQQRYDAALQKVLPSFGDMAPDRIKERLQGEMQAVSDRLQSKSMTPRDLVEEVHFCERRFGMPMSDLQAQ